MAILDEDVATVRAATDIVGLISQYTQLKRSGRRWSGLCPFHAERSPSLSVNAELGLYRCFGCQASGDAITFLREIEHLDFVGAVERLAATAGVALRYTSHDEGASRRRRGAIVDALRAAVEWYHHRLLSAPDAAAPRRYLRERGMTGEEVRQFRLGWAPGGWDELSRSLGLPGEVMRDAGLCRTDSAGRPVDVLRGRILFPIFDPAGDPVGFGGRAMPGRPGPKYLNSPETALYKKSKVLYGLNWSKARIVADDRAIVCEGYTDVIGFARVGLPAAVAPCGTALSEDHIALLRRYARRLVIAFDADAAGQAAAERLYAWERAYDLEVAVAVLPAGRDPGQLAVEDPGGLVAAVDSAAPFLGFRVERVLVAADLASPEGRARAAQAALQVIREHPDDLVRDPYVMVVADRCRVPPDRLRAALSAPGPERVGPARASGHAVGDLPPHPAAVGRDGPELEVLRHVIHNRRELEGRVHQALFADETNAATFACLMAHTTVREALDAAPPTIAELITRLATEDTSAEPFDALVRLVTEATRREVAAIGTHVAAQPDDLAALRVQHWMSGCIDRLREPATAGETLEKLVAWLGQSGQGGARG